MGILPSSISNQFKSVLYYNPHDIDILSQRVGNTSTVAGWLRALAKEPNRGSAVDAWCGVPTVLKQKTDFNRENGDVTWDNVYFTREFGDFRRIFLGFNGKTVWETP